MKGKIKLYQEVLELEPSSRIFFSLAQLHVASKNFNEAIAVLKKGVSRHPDHIEAYMLLVELLSTNDSTGLHKELEKLSSIFERYPSFWKVWAAHLANKPELYDVALAVNFFGAGLGGEKISWSDVIRNGLQSFLEDKPIAKSIPHTVVLPRDNEASGADKPTIVISSPTVPILVKKVSDLSEILPSTHTAPVQSAIAQTDTAQIITVQTATDIASEEESFSLRTRTMAEVLASQGDIASAIDIYKELMASAPEEEREDFQQRIQELTQINTPVTHSTEVDGSVSDGGRLVSLLESLAERLENRSR